MLMVWLLAPISQKGGGNDSPHLNFIDPILANLRVSVASQERDGVDVHRPATRERHLRQEVRGILAADYHLPAPATAEPGHEGRRRAQHVPIGQSAAVPL